MKRLLKIGRMLLDSDKFWAAALFLAVTAAFSPILDMKEFVLDDVFYFLNVQSVQVSLRRIFDPVLGLSTPLTSLSLYLDLLLWGKPHFLAGAHLTNILLHALSSLLLFLLLRQLRWKGESLSPAWAGMTVLIFALHPQRVESVAWLAERKDCLAMTLGLGALLLFQLALRKGKVSRGAPVLLVLSLLAKPMWIFFPLPAAALILLEQRSFRRKFWCRLLAPSLLVFLLFVSWQFSAVARSAGSAVSSWGVPLLFKLETIGFNYGSYFLRTFLPGNLSPVYPYYNPQYDLRWLALIPPVLLLTPLLARRRECRDAVLYGVLPALVCFAVTLVPVVGFARVGNTDFADRYSYLPSLYLVVAAAFLLRFNFSGETALGRWLPLLGVCYCAGLLWQTERYLPHWKSSQGIVDYALRDKEPNLNMAISAAVTRYFAGKYAEAARISREKLPESPRYPADFNRMIQVFKLSLQGLILFQQGRAAEGITFLNTVYMSPYSGMVYNFPIDFAQKVFTTGAEYHLRRYGDRKAAANLYMRCSELFKFHAPVYGAFYAGMAALTEQDFPAAVRHFRRAHELNPSDERCLRNLRYAQRAAEGNVR